ncbi:hypothetical protein LD731_08560 [Lactobacillus delbrueckii subsp. delbrueckii]|uniref:hypothetical protein n=1 Tax=Lactobacillus delbrueckii TaxID=1584 RepID=UPI00090B53B5|nr:hypothetical protein [Lactobacillus delbrueckii]APG72020.1 hypothetical protein LD731_08560 [Lactobacillus delbrueckii subsp. delbrueckii]BBL27288.1 hypothetical protein LDE01_05850 [Lactobacillus delbrueckii subsp. delbrueckii]BBL28348.1 hypothetical protein LDE01_16450 [Lactobacillus delbrueckii subsp. delbrueckii]GEA75921.1 hypothetical protein LDE03_17290 [Lactobacillus delbrueckii subsp. delbrueckii]
MTEHQIVPLELPKGRVKPKNRLTRNRLVLNLKSKGVELSFYSDATNELMIEVVDRFLNHD